MSDPADICESCGCRLCGPDAKEKHSAWHRSLEDRLTLALTGKAAPKDKSK